MSGCCVILTLIVFILLIIFYAPYKDSLGLIKASRNGCNITYDKSHKNVVGRIADRLSKIMEHYTAYNHQDNLRPEIDRGQQQHQGDTTTATATTTAPS